MKDNLYSDIFMKKYQIKMLKENNKIKRKFYIYDWSYSYGWQLMGNYQGYNTIKELKENCKYTITNATNWKILEGAVIEEKKIK